MSVLWPSKYAKISFHDAPPDPLVGWRGDTPPHMQPHSTGTHLRRSPYVPQKSSQIYAYHAPNPTNRNRNPNPAPT